MLGNFILFFVFLFFLHALKVPADHGLHNAKISV